MHELRLAKPIAEQALKVAEAQSASRVTGIKIGLGVLSGVMEDHLREHLEELFAGTVLEGAQIETRELLPGEKLPGGEEASGTEVVLESLTVEEA